MKKENLTFSIRGGREFEALIRETGIANNANGAQEVIYNVKNGRVDSYNCAAAFPIKTADEVRQLLKATIIGYKAPTDLYRGKYKKGSIWVVNPDAPTLANYRPQGAKKGDEYWALPSEIVETWEPVFEDEGYKAGEWVTIVSSSSSLESGAFRIGGTYQLKYDYTPSDGKFLVVVDDKGSEGNGYSSNMWEKLKVRKATSTEIASTQSFKVAGFEAEFTGTSVKFGCQTFSREEVRLIHKLVNERSGIFSLTANGETVSPSVVQRVYKRLIK